MQMNRSPRILNVLTILVLLWPAGVGAAWVQKASFGGEARHRCTGFAVGNKGYIGLGHTNSATLETFKDFWQYDPATDAWSQVADFGGGYRYHATAFTVGNYAYVGLGENDLGQYTSDFWKYIPLINTWVQVAPYPGIARRGACAFVIDNLGYVGTGQTELGYVSDFYCYNSLLNSWDPIADFTGQGRSSCISFNSDTKGYVGAGHIDGSDTNDFYMYDPLTDTWIQKAPVGGPDRQDATSFVVNGIAYAGTGNDVDGIENFDDFWKYDFENDTWTQAADFDGSGRRYMVSFVIHDVAYCGTGTNGTNLKDFWAFHPFLGNPEQTGTFMTVFPNPASEKIRIDLGVPGLEETLYLSVFDPAGRFIFGQQLTEPFIDVYKEQTGNGFFSFIIQDSKGGLVTSGKFTITL
jgi:N-acetylneuraminic acid mutarotase